MKNFLKSTPIYALVCTAALSSLPTHVANAAEVVVYSARSEPLIKPLFDAYTKATGVTVKFITDAEGPLLARLKAEGKNTPADVLLTVDAGNLWQATDLGLLKPVQSKVLQANIPAHLHDPNNAWFGMSVRARTIVYNTQKVKPSELSSYEDLASSTWKNRLCLRTSKKVYNQSLVAMLMSEHGTAKAEAIVKGWVNNLATPPIADDTKAIESVAAGLCDVTIVNTYYFGRLKQQSPQLPVAIFWPSQAAGVSNSGVHVNISGAGVTTYAPHPAEAVKLVEWLSSEKAQSMYADINMEYPANPRVKPAPIVASWGTFKQSPMNVNEAGKRQSLAVMLMDRVGYK